MGGFVQSEFQGDPEIPRYILHARNIYLHSPLKPVPWSKHVSPIGRVPVVGH